jgi:hypothetical protein
MTMIKITEKIYVLGIITGTNFFGILIIDNKIIDQSEIYNSFEELVDIKRNQEK